VPGVIESLEDVLELPVKVDQGTVITFGDVATGRRGFKDPEGFARVNGQPAIALEIRKRVGANIIDTVADARAVIDAASADWPETVRVDYLQDMGQDVRDLLGDLVNNVITAILLVMLTIVAALGGRSSWLAGLAIPGAFLGGILAIQLLGFTLNIVVLFSLILVVGMLVDGAIIVVEQADRYLAEGLDRREAFQRASIRMAWPVIASTATTLAVFLPMLFWPGLIGEFMFYLPATVLVTLAASLLMALLFIPVLGSLVGARDASRPEQVQRILAAERGDFAQVDGVTAHYIGLLRRLIAHPAQTVAVAVMLMVTVYMAYAQFGRGVEFFPHVEPRFAQVQVQARGDLSVWEADQLVRAVEARMLHVPEIRTVYTRTIGVPRQRLMADYAEDVIGIIQLELLDWRVRAPAAEILERLREDTADLPGILLQFREQEGGPPMGKPIQVEVSGRNTRALGDAIVHLRGLMDRIGGFVDVEDDRSIPGVELRVEVNHREAARYGADISLLGNAVQMVTQGIRLGGYRPDDADEEVDIRVRFRGQAEEQAEASRFLGWAFLLSVFLMLVVLVTQFNSLYQAALVLSAIVFSTSGVLLGLLLRQEPFGIVMSGVGVIALAGIVVNNNIVLIDTFNRLRQQGLEAADAAPRTGAQRLRPVLLTTLTTILGLMPMVFAVTVDFVGRDFSVGAPSTQYWVQLATAISGGLLVATPLTLLVWGSREPARSSSQTPDGSRTQDTGSVEIAR